MKEAYQKNFRLGVLGGGQLGRMLIQEAIDLDVRVAILDPSPDAPCAQIAHEFNVGSFNDYQTVYDFGKDKDVVTIEIENVNVEALLRLESEGVKVFPQPSIIAIIKDKGLQKQFYTKHRIENVPYRLVENKEALLSDMPAFPFVQKLCTGGYDGRGVQVIKGQDDLHKLFDAPSVIEEMVDISKEISVIVARNSAGEVRRYPVVELSFNPEANLVEFLFSPAQISSEVEAKANALALQIVEAFDFVGLLAVELFVTASGEVLVNEIAPRTHNSGHHSIEGNLTSQFAQHLRAILGWPLGATDIIKPAVMINLLGAEGHQGPVYYEGMEDILKTPGAYVHLYGKAETKPYRKMGHLTFLADNIELAKERARWAMETLKVLSH